MQRMLPSFCRNTVYLSSEITKTETSSQGKSILCIERFAKMKSKSLQDCTKKIYNQINKPFQRTFGVSFADAETNVPELGLKFKESQGEQKATLRNLYRKVKMNIREKWNNTSVERYMYYIVDNILICLNVTQIMIHYGETPCQLKLHSQSYNFYGIICFISKVSLISFLQTEYLHPEPRNELCEAYIQVSLPSHCVKSAVIISIVCHRKFIYHFLLSRRTN